MEHPQNKAEAAQTSPGEREKKDIIKSKITDKGLQESDFMKYLENQRVDGGSITLWSTNDLEKVASGLILRKPLNLQKIQH